MKRLRENNMRTKDRFDVVDESGEVIKSFRNKKNARDEAARLTKEMFGAKYEVKRKE